MIDFASQKEKCKYTVFPIMRLIAHLLTSCISKSKTLNINNKIISQSLEASLVWFIVGNGTESTYYMGLVDFNVRRGPLVP